MNCAHCGRKNSEEMLFCGFCGRPLGTREDAPRDVDPERAIFGRPPEIADVPEPAAADLPEEEIPPLEVPLPERPPRPPLRKAPEPEGEEPLLRSMLREPVELRAKRPPVLTRGGAPVGARNPSTVVPPRRADEKNIFLEDDFEDDFDDFDDDFDGDFDGDKRRGAAHQSFFMRHARGLVALFLLLITLLIVGYWLFYGAGQRVLGQLYLSGNPATYIALGDEAEGQGAQEVAGAYFLKALELDSANRTYAIKAANAYILAGNAGKATAAIEKLIEMNPSEIEPYLTLKSLYPDPAARPQKVVSLIDQGRQLTGDARLQDG